MPLAHPIFRKALGGSSAILRTQLVVNLDVKVSSVLLVGLHLQIAHDLLSLLYREDVTQVEDCLLPVCVLGVRARGESDGLVTRCKVDVEPCYERVHEIIASAGELEWYREGEISCGAGVEIKSQDCSGVSHGRLDFDGIDKRFG